MTPNERGPKDRPTARERYQDLQKWVKPKSDEIKFLIALVEAAMDGWSKDYSKVSF